MSSADRPRPGHDSSPDPDTRHDQSDLIGGAPGTAPLSERGPDTADAEQHAPDASARTTTAPTVSLNGVPEVAGAPVPHVVVVGGGFAGANTVRQLRNVPVKVTLIDRNLYKTFQPLLYQVASAGLNPGDVTMFLRGLRLKQPNMRFRQGTLNGVDTDAKVITLEDGTRMRYDHLVLAAGAETNFFGTPGAREHAMPMYTREQALAIRDRIFEELERSTREESDDRLCITIVGGGPTGVEIAGALADFIEQDLDVLYPELPRGLVEISVVQRSEILKEFRPSFRKYAKRELEDRNVVVRLGHGVTEVGEDWVELDDGERYESDITIWGAGVGVADQVEQWGLPQSKRGRILTDEHCRVRGLEGVYAAGDIASLPKELPQLAQPAKQTGEHVAAVIANAVLGTRVKKFRYRNLGIMATIGRHAAIAEIPKFPDFSGSIGWVMWIAVHIRAMIGHRNRRAVAMNLVSLYLGFQHSHQPNPIVGDVRVAFPPKPRRRSRTARRADRPHEDENRLHGEEG